MVTLSSQRPEYAHPVGVEQLDPYYVEEASGDDGGDLGEGESGEGREGDDGGQRGEDDEGGEPLAAGLDGLPVFLEEPRGGWVTRDGAGGARLRCRAAHALRAHISCGGRRLPAHSGSFVDPQSGVRVVELEAAAPRAELSCRCHAWSGRGHVRSRTARLHLACEYRPLAQVSIAIPSINL